MASADLALISMDIYGDIGDGEEHYHELYLRPGLYDIDLEAEEDVDLDLYITNSDDEVIYGDESEDSGASAWLEVMSKGVFRLFVKAYGDTEYTITLEEQED